jgi:hypothetical protein
VRQSTELPTQVLKLARCNRQPRCTIAVAAREVDAAVAAGREAPNVAGLGFYSRDRITQFSPSGATVRVSFFCANKMMAWG